MECVHGFRHVLKVRSLQSLLVHAIFSEYFVHPPRLRIQTLFCFPCSITPLPTCVCGRGLACQLPGQARRKSSFTSRAVFRDCRGLLQDLLIALNDASPGTVEISSSNCLPAKMWDVVGLCASLVSDCTNCYRSIQTQLAAGSGHGLK